MSQIFDERSTMLMPRASSIRRFKGRSRSRMTVETIGTRPLHQVLSETQITSLQKVFQKEEHHQLNQKQFRKALHDHAHIAYDDDHFELTFLRINIKRDGFVTWDEFISHLILGFKIQEVAGEAKALESPISKKPRYIKSYHRHPINCFTFNHQVKPDRSFSYSDGSYITCSKDGMIHYWSLDLQIERTAHSKSPDLKVSDTYVLAVVCLPDVSVICTASTERDLRFYDTSARKFELRVQIKTLDYAVCSMYYVFHKDANEECKLILGDMGGHVRILLFSPINRGPFRSKLGIPLLSVYYDRVLRGLEPGFHVVEFKNLHKDWVRQVAYYNTLNFIVSCSTSQRAVVMRDFSETRGVYCYWVPKGVWCFALAEGFSLLATGGPDCLVRVWNPYVTKRPLTVFSGHHTGILALVIQDKGEVLFSISEDRCIKVWDIAAQACLQTYLTLSSDLGDHRELCLFYNPESREVLIGGSIIAVLNLRPLPNGEHTDGNSHSAAISVILYNPLFKIILTCGLDSFIIVWDPFEGKRISVVRDAHTRRIHGEVLPVDITAGTFDPGYQLLLTGAYDGTLKTWNFNTGTCLRNMRIEIGCEVTGVCWVNGRILAVGWNRHVTEFSDSGGAAGPGGAFSKNWSTKHTDDVLCVAAKIPETLATSTYNGELVLWRLETGQPYKQYSVANPTKRIKIHYDFDKRSRHEKFDAKSFAMRKRAAMGAHRHSSTASSINVGSETMTTAKKTEDLAPGKKHTVVLPQNLQPIRGLAVRCMLFLTARPTLPTVGTLLVALENGDVQIWSHHTTGGFLGAFQAVHTMGDYVLSMATDEKNDYLFTGSTEGYIKTFLMKNFFMNKEEKVCMPLLRLTFPFLWKRIFLGRADRVLAYQKKPMLLNSYRAHRSIVSGLIFIDKNLILVSSSADFSARLWTLGGRYIGTLGTFKPWNPIDPDEPLDDDFKYSIPPDVKRVMSSTTLRVFMGKEFEGKLTKKQQAAFAEKDLICHEGMPGLYGKKLEDPILGHYIKLPEKTTHKFEITLNTSFPHIPVYQHVTRVPPKDMPTISLPESHSKYQKKSVCDNNNMW